MAEKLKLELVTPYKRVLSEEVDEVTAPGLVGEFGVLPGHTPLLTTLRIGELTYKQGNRAFHVAVNWGYVEVEDDTVTVLVETAEPADQIDLARAKAALSRAEEALRKLSPEDKQFKVMECALERALIRVQVAGKKTH
ncbi:MAG: F0F1 ATP synthase subunit epsilon [Deltaproteobacteria bacterium]|jgi:F-type H+-transporting ATPase subunit epsilon|nr:F0F1 ATP synthase subunit epsilon [Deltaproteobacteria bacterium]MBW2519919.1 F0F1 ATP synthase subunit epsilon [Deltaproteobacteria bacterium]